MSDGNASSPASLVTVLKAIVGLRVFEDDGGVGDHGPAGIGNGALDLSCAGFFGAPGRCKGTPRHTATLRSFDIEVSPTKAWRMKGR